LRSFSRVPDPRDLAVGENALAGLLRADEILGREMVSGGVLQTVAGDRPLEQPACVDKRLPGSLRGAAVDDLVDEGAEHGAGDMSNRTFTPTGDKLAPDPPLDLAGSALACDMSTDESLGHDAERAGLGGDRGARFLRFAGPWVDAILHLDQHDTRTLARL